MQGCNPSSGRAKGSYDILISDERKEQVIEPAPSRFAFVAAYRYCVKPVVREQSWPKVLLNLMQ